ncbi:hypothetical protein Patl1_27643 [Pistacia atlantica]|uniref:Uncharacterized protein n=1 Tax=Pistacia atlantica TaxID=434234 RepID=A0ACC1BFG9_9ROSI|nr:hypothetical protein Patl1_27643 [Pistacia atlantica]
MDHAYSSSCHTAPSYHEPILVPIVKSQFQMMLMRSMMMGDDDADHQKVSGPTGCNQHVLLSSLMTWTP